MKIQPLKTSFKIDEDANVEQQISERANSESNYSWCRKSPEMTIQQRADYHLELGRKHLAQSKYRWNYKPKVLMLW